MGLRPRILLNLSNQQHQKLSGRGRKEEKRGGMRQMKDGRAQTHQDVLGRTVTCATPRSRTRPEGHQESAGRARSPLNLIAGGRPSAPVQAGATILRCALPWLRTRPGSTRPMRCLILRLDTSSEESPVDMSTLCGVLLFNSEIQGDSGPCHQRSSARPIQPSRWLVVASDAELVVPRRRQKPRPPPVVHTRRAAETSIAAERRGENPGPASCHTRRARRDLHSRPTEMWKSQSRL